MDELDEILAIAKVFLVEERMKNITCHIKIENIIEKTSPEPYKKPKNSDESSYKNISKSAVRGFN